MPRHVNVVISPDGSDLAPVVADATLRDLLIGQLEGLGYTVRAPGQLTPCDHIKPGTLEDVLPIRCRLHRYHRDTTHWHPPLWPNTGDVVWTDDNR